MFATFLSLSVVLVLVQSVLAQYDFTIDTPTLVQCESAQIDWTSTSHPPYDLLVVPANNPCGPALEDLGNQTSTNVNWTVNIAAGTQVVLSLMDVVGNEAWSGTITIGNSNNTGCLMGTGYPSSSPSPTPTSSAARNANGGSSTTSPHPTSSAFSPAGAAGAGLTSGALSIQPLSAAALSGSAVLAIIAFTL